jgi:hypothetical protein
VDTWINTPFSSAGKTDLGTLASLTANPAFYVPSGTGAAPAFDKLQWVVFDQETGDDNDLSDHPTNPVAAAAPYHIARILASQFGQGTISFELVEAGGPIIPFSFFYYIESGVTLQDYDIHDVAAGTIVMSDLDANMRIGDFEASGWSLGDFDYFPAYGGVASNGTEVNASVDENGQFTWDTHGASRGIYRWLVFGHGGVSIPAYLQVHITTVPEPASVALFAVAMLRLSSWFRRR